MRSTSEMPAPRADTRQHPAPRPAARTFVLCRPRFYGVEYVINPWMDGNVGRARRDAAKRQWEDLHTALAARVAVEVVEPEPGLPDMTFAANAGLACEGTFIPSRFRFPQRRPEVAHYTEWFRRHGYRIVELPGEGTFEGEGDALFHRGTRLVWGGYGVRTSLQAHRHLSDILAMEVVPLRLIDERFYHLDTCFCPLPDGRVMYFAEAFDRESLETIRGRVAADDRFEVDATDALNFACNAIVSDRTVIANFASPALRERLETWGLEVVVSPVSEFILAGGATKCLVLDLTHAGAALPAAAPRPASPVRERLVEVQGHLLDSGLMNRVLDCIADGGGSFEIETLQPGLRHDQSSIAHLRVIAPSAERLAPILGRLIEMGARVAEDEGDARLETVTQEGVAPADFYSTTIFPTEIRWRGRWLRVEGQRMDAVLVVEDVPEAPDTPAARSTREVTPADNPAARATQDVAPAVRAKDPFPLVRCRLFRDLRVGDQVVCGIEGVRTQPTHTGGGAELFGFMSAEVSSERRVELAVDRIAWEMRRIRTRGGKIVVVAGPVVIHTGGGPHLARLIERGYVQALLGGNGLAVHDIEHALYGTSLGVDLKRGVNVQGGHRHHLKAINQVRACGGIANAVAQGLIQSGVMYECVRGGVPFALAGSIRDDGPLPETLMDLVAAQTEYARLITGADMILMLSSMLHAIGVGNMTPAGVRLICVDISPAVVTKLADRGSLESIGMVTDVGLFLNLLDTSLGTEA